MLCYFIPQNQLTAQDELPSVLNNFDLSASVGPGPTFGGGLMYARTHGLLASKKLRLGYGLRVAGMAGSDLNYITAPAKLTADEATIDSLVLATPFSMYANLNVHIQYFITTKLKVGFNIDVIGLGFGSKSEGTFISSENTGQFPTAVTATPSIYNQLIFGDYDLGQLGSELYVGYKITDQITLRGGANFVFSEYTTDVELTNENKRFRYKSLMGFIGVSYNPFSN